MYNNTKTQLKMELQIIKSQMGAASGLAATLGSQLAFPLPMGGVVTITAFQQASQVLKMQGDAMTD